MWQNFLAFERRQQREFQGGDGHLRTVLVPSLPPKNIQTTTMNKKQIEALRANFSDGLQSSYMIISTISEWYDAKHRKPCGEEISFINSLDPRLCPYCGGKIMIKKGFQSATGLRIWLCRKCGRKSSPLTGTIFDSRKIPLSEWVEHLPIYSNSI